METRNSPGMLMSVADLLPSAVAVSLAASEGSQRAVDTALISREGLRSPAGNQYKHYAQASGYSLASGVRQQPNSNSSAHRVSVNVSASSHNALDSWDISTSLTLDNLPALEAPAGNSSVAAYGAGVAAARALNTAPATSQATLHPLAQGASNASAGGTGIDFAAPAPIATGGNTPELAAAVSGLQTTSARLAATDRQIDASGYDHQTKVALKFSARVGDMPDLADEEGARAALDRLFQLLSQGAAAERYDYLQGFDKLFNRPRPDFSDVINEWRFTQPSVGTNEFGFAALQQSGSGSGSGSGTGPVNNCRIPPGSPDLSCADLDIVSTGPGTQDNLEDTYGALIKRNWGDVNGNGVVDYRERGPFPNMVKIQLTGIGYKVEGGSVREGTLNFRSDIFRIWRNDLATHEVISTTDLQGRPATILTLSEIVSENALWVECISAGEDPNSPAFNITLNGDHSATDTIKIYPVYTTFESGQVASNNTNPLPAHPQVLFAQANYATPLSFRVRGLPNVQNFPQIPNVTRNWNGVNIVNIKSLLLEANEDNTVFRTIIPSYLTSNRFVNGVNGDSSTRANGQSFAYTTFVPGSHWRSYILSDTSDWTRRAYFAMDVNFTFDVYPGVFAPTNADPAAASKINFYDYRVDAIDVSRDSMNPNSKTLAVRNTTGFQYFRRDQSAGNTGVFNAQEETTLNDLLNYFDSVTASSDPTSSQSVRVTKAEIYENNSRFARNRQTARVISTRASGGKVYVSYGGRQIPSVLGSEQAMDLTIDTGNIYMNLFPNANYSLSVVDTQGVNVISNGAGALEAFSGLAAGGLAMAPPPWGSIGSGVASIVAVLAGMVNTAASAPSTGYYFGGAAGITAENGRYKGASDNRFVREASPGGTFSSNGTGQLSLAFTQPNVPVGDAVVRNISIYSIVDGSERLLGGFQSRRITSIVEYTLPNPEDWNSFRVDAYA